MKQLALAILLPLALGIGGIFLFLRMRPVPPPEAETAPALVPAAPTPVQTPIVQTPAPPAQDVQPPHPEQISKPTIEPPEQSPTISPPNFVMAPTVIKKSPLPTPLSAYGNGAIDSWPSPTIPLSPLSAQEKAECQSALDRTPPNCDALMRAGVITGNHGYVIESIPYFERYLAAGGTLYPDNYRWYALSLAMMGRFDDSLKVLEKMKVETGVFPFTGVFQFSVNMRRCLWACEEPYDVELARKAFIEMCNCDPNLTDMDYYGLACFRVIEAVTASVNANSLRSLDSLWPYMPDSATCELAARLKQRGIAPTQALIDACDVMNSGKTVPASAMVKRATFVWCRGKNSELALKLAERALSLARTQKDKEVLVEALWCVVAIAHARGELEMMYLASTEAKLLCEELKQAGRTAKMKVKLGTVYEDLGDYRAAMDAYHDAIDLADRHKESWSSNDDPETGFYRVGCFIGDAAAGEGYFKKKIEDLKQINPNGGHLCIPYYNLGLCLSRTKKYDEAINALQHCMITNSPEYRTYAAIECGRDFLALKDAVRAEKGFSLAQNYDEMTSNRESRWAWQYGEAIARRMQSDTAGAQRWIGESVKTIEEQRASLKDYNSRRSLQDNKYGVYEFAIELALERKDQPAAFALAERSRARTFLDALGAQAGAAQAAAPAPADLPQVQAACRDFAAVIYFQCKSNLLVWIVRNDGLVLISLPLTEQQLFESIQQLHVLMLPDGIRAIIARKRKVSDWKTVTQSIYRDIWESVETKLRPGERVCIVPHRAMHYIPFQALHDGKHFLVENRDIFYAPSGSGLVALAAHKAAPAAEMVVFDPIRSPDPNSPFHYTESESIGRTFPAARITVGKDATVAAFKGAISNAGTIHVSSHGSFNAWIPARSGLHFAETATDDGALHASDVFGMKLKGAPLVVMSACVSSVGDLSGGDEVTGLTRAFQVAGAQNVIGSLWPVDNAATTRLMGMFYEELKKNGSDPTAALCKAQRRFLATDPAPAGWAAFELNGTGVAENR